MEVRDGSFYEPVRDETFDLIATNPPFVISPATGERLVYRVSGRPGVRVVEAIVRLAPRQLNAGGGCQVLANWVIDRDRPWDDRLGSWLTDECDAYVVQREVLDPAAYVELWLKDAGLHGAVDYLVRYDTWLSWFDEQGVEGIGFGWINLRKRPGRQPGGAVRDFLTWPYDVEQPIAWFEEQRIEAVGFGWINLRRTDAERPEVRFEEWPYDVEQPIAPAIRDWATASRSEVGLDSHPVVRPDVQQQTVGAPGAEDPDTVVLRQQRGLRRARQADTVEAALVGACDGELSVGQILDALAQLLDRDPEATRTAYLPAVRELVLDGFLQA